MMPAAKMAFNLMGVDRVDLSTENESVKNIIRYYVEKQIEESQPKLSKQFDDN